MPRKKIVIIGGGLSSMSSLYWLSQEPDFESKYEVVVYQMGWRLGGKAASGVNRKMGSRIEEHGLHLFMGFYENAFHTMKSVYDQLNRPPAHPLSSFEKAFKGRPNMSFTELVSDRWSDWTVEFPKMPGEVGDGKFPSLVQLFEAIWKYIIHQYKEYHNALPPTLQKSVAHHTIIPKPLIGLFDQIRGSVGKEAIKDANHFLALIGKLLLKFLVNRSHDQSHIVSLLDNILHWLWEELGNLVETHVFARVAWETADLFITIMKGLIKDAVITYHGGSPILELDSINCWDYRQWLIHHGANEKITINSSLVRSMYDGPFAFMKGHPTDPNIEAGTILRIFLRLCFTCKEHIVWNMQAGMGDTIFGPIYQILSQRPNVTFKFFHKALSLHLSDDKSHVDSIKIARQVDLRGEAYHPLTTPINGLECWPSEPLYGQLTEADANTLQVKHINLESSWADWENKGELTLRSGHDYDQIILGASLASMPIICSELISHNSAWQDMIDNVCTVQTQAIQFWLNVAHDTLGVHSQKILSTYIEPLDTFASMNHLIAREDWPAGHKPSYIAYLCGVLPENSPPPSFSDHTYPETQYTRVKGHRLRYFEKYLEHVLPGGYDEQHQFKWPYLVDQENAQGAKRLDGQYARANIDPSERYVSSVKGSSKFRIKTNETGFSNLFITGDWIQNGLNAGFVEGCIISGIQTARAVSGNSGISIYLPKWE